MTENNPASAEQSDSELSSSAMPALSTPAAIAAPAPTRRGLLGLAWGLIGGVPLLLLLAAAAGFALIGLVVSAASESAGCDDEGYCDVRIRRA